MRYQVIKSDIEDDGEWFTVSEWPTLAEAQVSAEAWATICDEVVIRDLEVVEPNKDIATYGIRQTYK